MPKYSLNLGESYVPEWGAWEVGREMICNAADADPSYKMTVENSDCIRLETETVPTIHELTILGLSQSRDSREKVGQFGEGFKLATLVALRSGGDVQVYVPEGFITFTLEKVSDSPVRVLHANLDRRTKGKKGCKIVVSMEGIAEAVRGKFVSSDVTWIEKDKVSDAKVFSKGVFITELKNINSVFDWNLNNLRINRDRGVVGGFDVKWEVMKILVETVDRFVWDNIFLYKGTLENQALTNVLHVSESVQHTAQESWKRTFGEGSVVASKSDLTNQIAVRKGYNVIGYDIEADRFGLPTANKVVKVTDTFDEVEAPQRILDEVNEALDLLEVPATVKFFKYNGDGTVGRAIFENGQLLVWLSDSLCRAGARAERLSALAHEVAHATSQEGDGSVGFEYTLDAMVGKLLVKLLDKR